MNEKKQVLDRRVSKERLMPYVEKSFVVRLMFVLFIQLKALGALSQRLVL